MKIIRYQDSNAQIHYARQHDDGSVTQLEGDIFGEYRDTGSPADVAKLLAPIVPVDILCIGLNYAHHAKEGGHEGEMHLGLGDGYGGPARRPGVALWAATSASRCS